MDEEFVKLLDILPTHIKNIIQVMDAADKDNMVEIVMDLKRELEVRFQKHFQVFQDLYITNEDIEYVVNKLKTFGPDDRAGLDGTLHRISKIDSRSGDIVGLTLRIGKDLSKGIDLLGENIINKSLILLGAPGSSKAQPLSSKILTPDGWSTMGEIQPGDQIISKSGDPATVISIHPQGEIDIYRVTFSDGSCVECCDDHLWAVKNRSDRKHNKPYKILPLKTIRRNYLLKEGEKSRLNYSVPQTPVVQFSSQEVSIDPYLIGVLLGDGSLSNNFRLSTVDQEIIDNVNAVLPDSNELVHVSNCDYNIVRRGAKGGTGLKYENPLRRNIKTLGLWGCVSNSKFIPEAYLINTVAVRQSLLQGLLDTDGSCGRDGNITFTTVSARLAEDVIFLVRSLGGIARKTQSMSYFTYKDVRKQGQLAYTIAISLPGSITPFSLSRKTKKYSISCDRYLTRYIKSIEYIGKKEAQCIFIDHPDHLYITDDFVLTHNTTKLRSIANYLSIELSKKVIVVDTSNEIGGEGDIPHKAIGRARRMQVPNGKTQAHIMIKAVENHNPDVIIIDEIGTEEEALAAVTIAQRGVQLIATAHGKILQDLMENRPLDALVGGMNKVTVSDETMILSGLKSKTQLNRVHEPPFDMLIEIVGYDEVRIYSDLAHAVDTILAGGTVQPEERRSDKNGKVITTFTESYQPLDGPRRQYKPEVQPPVEKAPQRGRTSQARRRR